LIIQKKDLNQSTKQIQDGHRTQPATTAQK
jgi:hypothetical protein